MSLARKILNGNMHAAARLMRRIDDEMPDVVDELKELYAKSGNAYMIGLTGTPGVGKSTIVNKMITEFRNNSKTVGVIAIDPTSPFSGGAILGDRIRMQDHCLDEGVFIKSLATRGSLGGLSYSTGDIIKVMDAMGKDIIIIETVGVGQSEVDIINSCHTSIVTLAPGLGDDIQMMKAGILEIGDIFVINKADKKDGVTKLENELRVMLRMKTKKDMLWEPLIFKTIASEGTGIKEMVEGIYEHRTCLGKTDRIKDQTKENIKHEFLNILQKKIAGQLSETILEKQSLDQIVEQLYNKSTDPYSIIEEIINKSSFAGL